MEGASYKPMEGSPIYASQKVYGQAPPSTVMYGHPASPIIVVHPHEYERVESTDAITSIVVFLLGFCCCPIWCAGWMFVARSPHGTTSRLFGLLSVAAAIISTIVGCIVLAVVLANPAHSPACRNTIECDSHRNAGNCGYCTAYRPRGDDSNCATRGHCAGHWTRNPDEYCAAFDHDRAACGGVCNWCSTGRCIYFQRDC